MNYYLNYLITLTIIIPAVVGLIRLNKINRIYWPLVLLLWTGVANEITSYFTGKYLGTNAVNSNIYCILESYIIIYLFYRLGLFERDKIFPACLAAAFTGIWVWENFIFQSFSEFNSYFTICSSFCTVIMAILMLNKLLSREKKNLWTNPLFIICIGFIMFYSYSGVLEVFWQYSFRIKKVVGNNIYKLLNYVNFLNNILYTYAILCMRRKLRFTMQS